MRIRYLGIVLVLLALVLPASPAHAGGVVTVCDEAHLLTALEGGGTVTFDCSGTIALTAEIVVSANTTIDGSGQDVIISGEDMVPVLTVGTGVAVKVKRLIIANGHSDLYGGGIANEFGDLTIEDSAIVDNVSEFGGGIYNGGTMTVSSSSLIGNYAGIIGGGISSTGTAVVDHSTISDNYGLAGGGIDNAEGGTMIISNSTVSGNGARFVGGIHDGASSIVTILNSTVADNWLVLGKGASNISNDPLGTTILKNTIVAIGVGGNCDGNITNGGGNLSYPDASCPGINADPVLGPLQNNGGPTWTMALGPGSAAIDAAVDGTCAGVPVNNLDQRGVVRPQGLHCDIGAFEWVCPSFVPPAQVGVEDIVAMASLWGWTDQTPGWDPQFDLNLDRRIDILDIMLVTAAWGYTCS